MRPAAAGRKQQGVSVKKKSNDPGNGKIGLRRIPETVVRAGNDGERDQLFV